LLIRNGAKLKRARTADADNAADVLKLAFESENDELLELVINNVDDIKGPIPYTLMMVHTFYQFNVLLDL